MKNSNVVDKLVPLLATEDNFDLVNATVRLLLNLSFDTELRARMIKVGLLPKLVLLMKKCSDDQHQHSRQGSIFKRSSRFLKLNPVRIQSQSIHNTVAIQSESSQNPVRIQSESSHNPVTIQSQSSHNPVTIQSQSSHNSVTIQSLYVLSMFEN